MILKNEKRLARFEYDFAVDGGAIGAIKLRPEITQLTQGMVVTDFIVVAEKALAGAATPTVTFGDGTDADAFLANSFGSLDEDLDVVRANDLALVIGEGAELTMTVGAQALTAGKLVIYVEHFSL